MTVNMAIQGIGTVGGFGCGVNALKKTLNEGPPVPETVELETKYGTCPVKGLRADARPLREFVPVRVLRRMEHHIRIALLAAFDALADAERRGIKRPPRLGIVLATGYGATCNSYDFQHLSTAPDDFGASPTQFSNSVHNAAAGYIAIALSEEGPNHTVSHYDASIPMALSVAAQWLGEARVDAVLLGAVDEFSKAQAYAWQMRADAKPQAASLPVIGEGACFFLLTGTTGSDGAYGHIDGVGLGRQTMAGGLHLPLPEAGLYLLGADGFGKRDGEYPAVLPPGCPTATYAHVYGALPVGMAFDLAIAALSCEARHTFASAQLTDLSATSHAGRPLNSKDRLCCFKLGAERAYGWAIVAAAEGVGTDEPV